MDNNGTQYWCNEKCTAKLFIGKFIFQLVFEIFFVAGGVFEGAHLPYMYHVSCLNSWASFLVDAKWQDFFLQFTEIGIRQSKKEY
jgi:hypothetical protein